MKNIIISILKFLHGIILFVFTIFALIVGSACSYFAMFVPGIILSYYTNVEIGSIVGVCLFIFYIYLIEKKRIIFLFISAISWVLGLIFIIYNLSTLYVIIYCLVLVFALYYLAQEFKDELEKVFKKRQKDRIPNYKTIVTNSIISDNYVEIDISSIPLAGIKKILDSIPNHCILNDPLQDNIIILDIEGLNYSGRFSIDHAVMDAWHEKYNFLD